MVMCLGHFRPRFVAALPLLATMPHLLSEENPLRQWWHQCGVPICLPIPGCLHGEELVNCFPLCGVLPAQTL